MYLKNLKETLLENFSSFDDSKSLENELNGIEETFRNPTLLIESIREMHRKQEESLNSIQMKLYEMNRVKDNLKASNGFEPNLILLNQEGDTSLFGSLKSDGYWLKASPFKGQILTNHQQCSELLKLCEFSPDDQWSLLYRGSRDGFSAKDFHSKCDGHPNTLTILKAKHSSYIFGGFTSVYWEVGLQARGTWKSDPNAFIFSLTNKDNKPIKMKIHLNQHQYQQKHL